MRQVRTDASTHSVAGHGITDASTNDDTRTWNAIDTRRQKMHDEGRATTAATPAHHVTELGAASDS